MFQDYRFRPSEVGRLMTGLNKGLTEKQIELFTELHDKMKSGKITDKQIVTYGQLLEKKNQKPQLSVGAKSFIEEKHKEVLFGKSKDITNKYLSKGIEVEEFSITLYSEVTKKLYLKNKETFKNDFLIGTPDNVQGKIRDIKSSWDFTTFPIHETEIPNQLYYWQLQAYMDLTNLNESELIYCLVDTPLQIIEDEKRRVSWKLGYIDLPDDLSEEIENNLTYSKIPKELRVKIFKVEKSESDIQLMHDVIKMARTYMDELSLNIANRIELIS